MDETHGEEELPAECPALLCGAPAALESFRARVGGVGTPQMRMRRMRSGAKKVRMILIKTIWTNWGRLLL